MQSLAVTAVAETVPRGAPTMVPVQRRCLSIDNRSACCRISMMARH
ncbi:hypothetical protein [Bradyrhizobium sp.]|nr:hypothetical protein [Bradyrhizobium sp.]HMM90369.1 hypothetical protein [Bradyrhizobium sp.]